MLILQKGANGLKKYLMCITNGWPNVSKMESYILEADAITGPWRLVVYMKDFGEQAYFLNFPSKSKRKTMTVDNGKEFAGFKETEKSIGVRCYFANPYSSYRRGTNENTTGLLRQFFPNGTDFNEISEV